MTKNEIKAEIETLDFGIECLTGYKTTSATETKKAEWRRDELVAKRDALIEKLHEDEI